MRHITKALVCAALTFCVFVAMQATAVAVPVGADAYEPDDTYLQATPIAVDGTPQAHTFHSAIDWAAGTYDNDWVSFIASSDVTYRISAVLDDAGEYEPYLTAYASDGTTELEAGYSPLLFKTSEAQTIYLEVSGGQAGSYTLSVTAQPSVSVESPLGVSLTAGIDFGRLSVGEYARRSVWIRNAGLRQLDVTDLSVAARSFANGEYAIVTDGASGQSISPGDYREVVLEFRPKSGPAGSPNAVNHSELLAGRPRPLEKWYRAENYSLTAIGYYHYFRNTGGPGSIAYEAVASNDVLGHTTVSGTLSGTGSVVGGDAYACETVCGLAGLADEAMVDLALPASYDHRVIVGPLWPSTNVRALGAVQAVNFHRLEDAALIVLSNDPEAAGDDYGTPPGTFVSLFGEGMAGSPTATQLSFSAPSTSEFSSAKVYGYLKDMSGKALSGKPVEIWVYSGTWKKATTVTTNSDGYYAKTMAPKVKTKYRAYFAGDNTYLAKTSTERTVLPKARLTRSTSWSTLYQDKAYTATGYIEPYHATSDTNKVRVLAYKKGTDGVYRYVKSFTASYTYYSSTKTKWSAKVVLPSTGSWRIRARHEVDAKNATSYSSYDYVTVKPPLIHYSSAPRFSTYTHTYGKTYSVWGYIKPKHATGSTQIKVKAYRKEKQSDGTYKYVYKRTFYTKISNPSGSSYSKYKGSVELPSKGKWRVRAYHAADSKNSATHSSYRYVEVK